MSVRKENKEDGTEAVRPKDCPSDVLSVPFYLNSGLLNLSVGHVRQQCHYARTLDSGREFPLMLCAGPRDASRKNFSSLRHELLQCLHIFIVDRFRVIGAELANLFLPDAAAPLSIVCRH